MKVDFYEPDTSEQEQASMSTLSFLYKYKIDSAARNFKPVSHQAFFNHQGNRVNDRVAPSVDTCSSYDIESFQDFSVIGEGTYGKVFKAKLKPEYCE